MRRPSIDADRLARMATINSRRMPRIVEQEGRRLEWVGIGWIDVGKARGNEPVVRVASDSLLARGWRTGRGRGRVLMSVGPPGRPGPAAGAGQ